VHVSHWAGKETNMTSARGVEGSSYRWPMLAVVSLGIVALTLNWFDVATAFPLIGAEFKVGLGSLSLLISLYIVGYGLTHIPGGVLATKIGMKRALVLGLLVQGAAGVMSGLSHSYAELAIFRIASGVGGSVFVAMTAASMVVWFREKEVSFALGVTGGAAFSAGAALALYVWLYVQRSAGGLLSALILLAGIPGSVLGGHLADRSTNLRMFVVGPLVTVAALLALIPVAPSILLWPLGIGIGFFLIFGFAAWLAVPSRVSNIRAEHIGSAIGLMLTLAAIGGFFIPIIFGHLVPHTSYGAGWVFLAVVSAALGLSA
jgi:MFS family permease